MYTFGRGKHSWQRVDGAYRLRVWDWCVVCPAGYIVARATTKTGAIALCTLLNTR